MSMSTFAVSRALAERGRKPMAQAKQSPTKVTNRHDLLVIEIAIIDVTSLNRVPPIASNGPPQEREPAVRKTIPLDRLNITSTTMRSRFATLPPGGRRLPRITRRDAPIRNRQATVGTRLDCTQKSK